MIGNTRQDVAEPSLRVDAVELGALGQGVDGGGSLGAAVRAREGPVVAAHGDAAFIVLPFFKCL